MARKTPYLDRQRDLRAVEPCDVCEHGKRDHEGQTGACTLCECKEYVATDDSPSEVPGDDGEY